MTKFAANEISLFRQLGLKVLATAPSNDATDEPAY